ncbi:MAG: zinc-binding dehydrogenase [Lentisphaerae bacterium]|nr:zinc-binding dehydrogenase [Lentisphaerota bacterium]
MNHSPSTIPLTMQAVRLHGAGVENIQVDTLPVPEPNANQVLARVDAAGVCTSILKLVEQGSAHTFINGWDLVKHPVILGDEGCVTVVQAGKNVASRYPVGRRYATQPAVAHPPINHRERYRNGGQGMEKVAIGYTLPGHLAEYMLVTEEAIAAECLLPLPSDDIPFFAGALCEPFSCVISAQDRHIHIQQESPTAPRVPRLGLLRGGVTVIIGAGPMGRMHAAAALRFSPRHLIVMDILAERLGWIRENLSEKARSAGTELHTVLSAEGPDLIKKVSNGHGADDIIAAVGLRKVQQESQQWLAKGGVLNLFGGLKRGEHLIELDTLRVHYDEIRLCGSSGGSPADVAEALRMVAAGEFDPGKHLDMVGSLDQFAKALELIKTQTVEGKIVLYPQIRPTDLERVNAWTRRDEAGFIEARRKA